MTEQDIPHKTGDIGGQPKQRYWTPDGRLIMALPDMREYSHTDRAGKVIDSGIRDANYDKGWLGQKPTELKLYCSHCDLWHDTQAEIIKCQRRKKAFDDKWTKRSKKEHRQNGETNDGRISKLETDVGEIKSDLGDIKNLLKKLINGGLENENRR